jgi:hypothetical protein
MVYYERKETYIYGITQASNIVDSDICKLCNNGIHDREHMRSCSILQDKLSDIDDFENMTKN